MVPYSFKRSLNCKIALTSQWDNPFWRPVRGILSFHIWLKGEGRPFIPKWFLQPRFIHPHMTNHYFSLPVHSQPARPNKKHSPVHHEIAITDRTWMDSKWAGREGKRKSGFLLRLNRSVSPTSSKWSHTWGSGKKLFSLIIFLVALLRDTLNYSLSLSVQYESSGALQRSSWPALLTSENHFTFLFFFYLCNGRNMCGPTSVCQCVCVCLPRAVLHLSCSCRVILIKVRSVRQDKVADVMAQMFAFSLGGSGGQSSQF